MPSGLCYGRTDVGLPPDADFSGIVAQLAGIAEFSLWSSPAIRCLAVADAIAAARGIAPRIDARLLELDFGDWEGQAWSDVPRDDLDRWAADLTGFAPPGGESGTALIARTTAFHRNLPSGCHVVVSHGGPLRVLAALAEGRPADLAMPAPALGSVRFFGSAGGDAEDGAFRQHLGSA